MFLCGLIQGKNISFILVFIEFIVSEIQEWKQTLNSQPVKHGAE